MSKRKPQKENSLQQRILQAFRSNPTLSLNYKQISRQLKVTQTSKKKIIKYFDREGKPLYGKDDGLFSETQIKNIENLIGEEHLKYISNCSHNLFIDQQTTFINALKEWAE